MQTFILSERNKYIRIFRPLRVVTIFHILNINRLAELYASLVPKIYTIHFLDENETVNIYDSDFIFDCS